MKNKLFGLTLGILFVSCMFFTANKVEAKATTVTSTLDFRNTFTTNQSDIAHGWSWDADTKTLTLTDFNCTVTTANKACLLFPNGSDITIVLEGDNVINTAGLASIGAKDFGTTDLLNSVLIKGNGSLSIDTTSGVSTDGAIRTKNLTLESGKLELKTPIKVKEEFKITGGELSAKLLTRSNVTTAIYVGEKLTISGGTVNIESGKPFQITGDSNQDSVAVEITGGNITLKGKYDYNVGTIYVANTNSEHKADIVINGGNITCSDAGYCFSTEVGDISINTGKANITASHMKFGVETGGVANSGKGTINIFSKKDPADLTELNKAIAEAEALNEDEYEDFSAVTTALTEAKKLLENEENLTEDDQDRIDELVEQINAAIKALKKVDLEPEPSNPSQPDDNNKDDVPSSVEANPNTFDGIITYIVMAIMSLIGIGIVGLTIKKLLLNKN